MLKKYKIQNDKTNAVEIDVKLRLPVIIMIIHK